MPITIGDAILWIRGRSDKLKGDLDQSEGQVKGWANRIKSTIGESMNYAVGQIMSQGINQLANGIENMARETINLGMTYARQVEDMARLSGASVEDASRIIQVADDMRLSYEDVSNALKMYAKTQADAGVAAQMSIDELARLSDQYLSLAPGVDRANFLLDNFGKSGLEMGKLMEQGGEGIRSMAEAVDESLIMDQEAIDQQRELEVAFDDLNDAMFGVKLQFAGLLAPYLVEFADWLRNEGIPALKGFVEWFQKLPAPVQGAIFAVGGIIVALAQFGPAIMGISGILQLLVGGAAGKGAAGAAGGGLLGKLGTGAAAAGTAIKTALMGALTAVAAALGTSVGMVLALVGAVGVLIAVIIKFGPEATKNFISLAGQWVQILVAAFNRIIFEFRKWLNNWIAAIRALPGMMRTIWNNVGKSIVDGIWAGLQGAWASLKAKIEALVGELPIWVQDALGAHSPALKLMPAGRFMAEGIGVGFNEAIKGEVMHTVVAGAGALASGANRSVQIGVGHVEYHGRWSQSEMAFFDRRQERIAESTLLMALEAGEL